MQEIIIKTIKFRNFLSFGNLWTEVDFTENLSTFVHGKNLDVNSANGSGKSGFFNVVVYGLYNKSISGISLQRLINSTNSLKNTTMEVILDFSKAGSEYQIHRKRGAENAIIFTKDGVDITPDSVYETDSLIEDTIGISYDLFSKIIVFSGSDVPFLDLPVSQQRAHIEELFNITILTEKAVVLKKLMQTTDSDIKVEEALIKEKLNNITAHEKRLQFAEQKVISWEESKECGIADLTTSIESVQNVDFEVEEELHDQRNGYRISLVDKKEKLSKLKSDLQTKNSAHSKRVQELHHLKENKCPYCLQKYEAEENKIAELKDLIAGFAEVYGDLSSNILTLQLEINETQATLDEVSGMITYEDLVSLNKTKNDLEYLKKKIEDLNDSENPHFDAFAELEREQLLKVDYSRLDELKSLKDHQSFLLKLLTNKDSFIRRKIINKTIPFLNAQINKYTLELGLQHVVRFDDNMSCTVSEYSRELDFGNLSGGEKKRVNLSLSLAFRNVLFHLHSRINLLLIDEIDSSICATGIQDLIRVLKKITVEDNLSTWVIMHREEARDKFDRQLLVTKSGGFSEVSFCYDQ